MKTLDILGYHYTVNETKPLSEMKGNSGTCDLDHSIIELANDAGEDMKLSTLLHEIIEAINFHLEIRLTEAKIKQLEAGLFQALTTNGVNLQDLLYKDN